MSRIYPTDSKPRTGYRDRSSVTGSLEREVPRIRFELIALPVAIAAVWAVVWSFWA